EEMKLHTRHSMILLSILLAAAVILSACNSSSTPSVSDTSDTPAASDDAASDAPTTAGAGSESKEAPMLTELVSSGALPALDERLPESPFVLEPRDEIGKYGETLFSAFPAAYQGQAYQTLGFYEPVLTWNKDLTELVPNLVDAYEPSADQMTFRMTIRKGLKWSDGEPVTTADIKFAF